MDPAREDRYLDRAYRVCTSIFGWACTCTCDGVRTWVCSSDSIFGQTLSWVSGPYRDTKGSSIEAFIREAPICCCRAYLAIYYNVYYIRAATAATAS
jgi:hypothetical protein